MSIKAQKKIKFIPILHMIIAVMWLRTYHRYPSTYTRFMSKVFLIFGVSILITIPRIILYYLSVAEWILNVAMWISTYIEFSAIAEIMVRDQEYIISEAEKKVS